MGDIYRPIIQNLWAKDTLPMRLKVPLRFTFSAQGFQLIILRPNPYLHCFEKTGTVAGDFRDSLEIDNP